MDLGGFAENVLDAVAGICGDTVVETQSQASAVLDAVLRRPGAERREVAAALGVSLAQLERCRTEGVEDTKNEVYASMCQSDAIHTGNILIERINQAAHWREEFRDMQNLGDEDDESCCDSGNLEDSDVTDTEAIATTAASDCQMTVHGVGIPTAVREKASALLGKNIDADSALKRRLVQRLEDEVFEQFPDEKDYRHCTRTVAASFRRNTMLAAGYASGRIPPQWIVHAGVGALSTRMTQLQRRCFQAEVLKEAQIESEVGEMRRKAQEAGKGTNLQPPAPNDFNPF
mmetsp:Transcript_93237/g.179132  ORF Transcript_93237/g.179132 Transcript_93237/m.179132 type:complete len:288 (+) Transcript_93237:67-930(+)